LKAKIIEEIDKFFIKELLERISWSNTAVLVTSDHATPCQLKSHSDAPVPFLLYHLDIKPDRLKSFDEVECRKGSFGVIEKGNQLLPMILKELQMIR
jgi:2,3-bisphosphoglycerate-independent phosphoglycerate mutase